MTGHLSFVGPRTPEQELTLQLLGRVGKLEATADSMTSLKQSSNLVQVDSSTNTFFFCLNVWDSQWTPQRMTQLLQKVAEASSLASEPTIDMA